MSPSGQGSTDIYNLHQAMHQLACTALQELHLTGQYSPALHNLCFLAMPTKPAQHCTIFTLQDCAPKACQDRDTHTHTHTHTHVLHSARLWAPSLSRQGSIDMQDLHFAGLCPSAMPSPCSKGLLFHLS
jgi:hypothetical protein